MPNEDKPVTSKHKCELELWRWTKPGEKRPDDDEQEKRPLELTGKEGELHSGYVLAGTVDLAKVGLYDILRGEMVEGRFPLFLMRLK